MERRNFIRNSAGALTLLGLFPSGLSCINRQIEPGILEKRELGKTGLKLSILGFGGIVVMDATPQEASDRVREAIENGVNYFDVAPTYGDAEVKLGPALEPYRQKVYLGCKTTQRSKDGSRKELEQSLKNLRTDHFDLYQLHAVTTIADVEQIFGPDGAIETFKAAKAEGKIRNIGFSAHSVEAAMMLMDRFDFDTIMFPVSASSWYAGNFGPQVLQRAQDKNMGILALKAMAKGPWAAETKERTPKCWYEPMTNPDEAMSGLSFTLSHPVTLAIPPGNENLFKMALQLVKKFEPLNPEEIEQIKIQNLTSKPLFAYKPA